MLSKYAVQRLVFTSLLLFATPILAACPELPFNAAQARIDTLSSEITEHNRRYYIEYNPTISDAAYDRLFAQLAELEQCFPALAATDSPTRQVGASNPKKDPAILREQPMLSLSSAADGASVATLLRQVAQHNAPSGFLIQPKIDGLPVELIYLAGQLISATTRGDGRSGEDVTPQVRTMRDIPQILPASSPSRLAVRGEVYADQQMINTALAEKYASPRHLAAGTLNTRNPDPQALATLRFFPFELVNADQMDSISSDTEALHYLHEQGFPIDPEHSYAAQSFVDIQTRYHDYLAQRETLPFASDGIVIKVDNLALRKKMGTTSRAPRWAAAWKFPPPTAQTRVSAIDWSIGRTGKRTPVAQLEPVRLNGSLISRASLHNSDEVARLGIEPGDLVIVALTGDTIPQIINVIGKSPRPVKASAPDTSPIDACFKITSGCEEQFLARASYFVGKSGLHIKGLGKKRLGALIAAGLIDDLPSILELRKEAIERLPGFGAKSAQQIATAIRAASKPEFAEILSAVGIPGLGRATAKKLAARYTSFATLATADQAQLQSVPGIGVTTAKNISNFLQSPGGITLTNRLRTLSLR